jgi:beta-glucosidase
MAYRALLTFLDFEGMNIMCRELFLSVSLILVLGPIAGPVNASLVALYEFDGSAMDSAGTNHGSEKGKPYYVAGVFGQAINLDGAGDYVDCGNDSVFNITNQITVAAWVNITAVPGDWRTIIAKGDTAWRLSTSQSQRTFHFAICGPPWVNLVDGKIEVPAGEWHHVCGTYDGGIIRLYVDGVLDSTKSSTEGVPTNTYNVYIGENAEATGRYWDGLIDDVAIFNHALTTAQLIQLMDRGGASFILPCGGVSLDGDINVDCRVNFLDFSLLAGNWLNEGALLKGDIYEDNKVDWLDLSLLVDNWLEYINLPPKVYAGNDQIVRLPEGASGVEVNLDGTVIDDGLPYPPGKVAVLWEALSGPNTVAFSNESSKDATATFSGAGTYLLRLTVSDSELSASDMVTITVLQVGNFAQRAAALMSQMTLEEKISQMGSGSPAIPRLGISAYGWWNEALHGVLSSGVTVFPQAIALAGTWDPNLIHQVATAISDEARVKNNTTGKGLTYWSPTINIARDPRWGRNEESYGEDPYLASRTGVAFVTGMQGSDPVYLKTVSTPKHFIANNTEYNRHSSSSNVDERNLREYYMPHFRACVVEGKAQSVMGAYNALNGVPCCANTWLLTEVLRDEWGFNGYVVSDCDAISDIYASHHYVSTAVEAAAGGVLAGTDLNCGSTYQDNLVQAIQQELLSEADIDRAVARLLMARFRLGEFDPPELVPYTSIPASRLDCQQHRDLALKTALESMVLLKNNGILPLAVNAIDFIAVIGPNANRCVFGGYSGTPNIQVTPLEGIQSKVAGHSITVSYEKGCDISEERLVAIPSEYLIPAGSLEEHGLKSEYFNNMTLSGSPALIRIDAKVDFDWGEGSPAPAVNTDKFSVRWTGKLVPPETKTYLLAVTIDDGVRLYLDGKLLINQWHDQAATTYSVPVNLQASQEYTIVMEFYENTISAVARLQWDYFGDTFANAVNIASKSDVAVVFVGTDLSIANEGHDRSDINLPGIQEDLIRAVYRANPNTIVVLINGSPVAINWTQRNVPAILEAWYPGQAGGTAIADVLFGDYNPGGKLPVTFYASITQLPSFDDYDIRKGRTYMYFAGQPLYPFGHGLSYTEFSYSNLQIDPNQISPDGEVCVSVDIQNVGGREGDEVVQLFVHDVVASVPRPIKELKRFKRISLQPGQTKTVTFTLPAKELAFYDVKTAGFVVEPGAFELMVGSSSAEIRLSDTIMVR